MGNQLLNRQRVALLIAGAVLVATCTASAAHAQQPPPPPQAFYGSVEVNGQPAPVGAQIEARGVGVKTGIVNNPLVTTVAGRYGGKPLSEPKLGVQGSIEEGALIEFYVNGVKAECAEPGGPWQDSYPFASGTVMELNLRAGQSATPTATQQSAAAGTPSSTSTSTALPAGGNTPRGDSPAPTATRQTPQAAGGGTSPQPTAGNGTPSPQPPTPVAQPTGPQKALITQPTQLASQSSHRQGRRHLRYPAKQRKPRPDLRQQPRRRSPRRHLGRPHPQPSRKPRLLRPGLPVRRSYQARLRRRRRAALSISCRARRRFVWRLARAAGGGRGSRYRRRCRGGDRVPPAIRVDTAPKARLSETTKAGPPDDRPAFVVSGQLSGRGGVSCSGSKLVGQVANLSYIPIHRGAAPGMGN